MPLFNLEKPNAIVAGFLLTCFPVLVGAAECVANAPPGGQASEGVNVIFEDNFDNHPDWTSINRSDNPADSIMYAEHGIPSGWFAAKAGATWSPSNGFPNGHEAIEILQKNSDIAFGGSGKSAVFWRESHERSYVNDKVMLYKLPEPQKKVYVEYLIKFSATFEPQGQGKIFRIYAWDEENADIGPLDFFTDGTAGPIYLWQLASNSKYGVRNFQSLRGGPFGENYWMTTPAGLPRNLTRGDGSLNYTNDIIGQAAGGTTAQLSDKLNGGTIPSSGNLDFRSIFGEEKWTKFGFYVEKNSAPGVADGKLVQWIDDKRILFNKSVMWEGPSSIEPKRADWHVIGLGGNEAFHTYPDSAQYSDWYAFDNILVMDGVPAHLSIEP